MIQFTSVKTVVKSLLKETYNYGQYPNGEEALC